MLADANVPSLFARERKRFGGDERLAAGDRQEVVVALSVVAGDGAGLPTGLAKETCRTDHGPHPPLSQHPPMPILALALSHVVAAPFASAAHS